ncbi:mannose-6-phosphate isomerase, class I [Subtercola boreus]|uniref:mannose-6-phosphate isomerase n=1 Tax=Subtercola boreus TaxID=120213 RepID=A0A3E0WEX0_9MICO|nr:mannose-6-phosphate isomerase, class I [Subtercola boreus]RFA22654.1 mannose-6-phosphate isomerase, class I [Subtercola boreus]RFA23009.1 mannose-6-phosphate isomerase, class I [Subtercola boreus]RFA28761.1 mannose-6-phosphate isomerase, class I [Subtercola boreus]
MFVPISNAPRDYAWGSESDISDLLGTAPTGRPQAELWLGAHPSSPSVIDDPAEVGGAANLAEWIAADPSGASGAHGQLPYLLKILSAGAPLSLQAHPTLAMAKEGFARENAAGLAADAPNRNYKDPLHKPEVIYALSDTFDALCGFRSLREIRSILSVLRAADDRQSAPAPELFDALASRLDGTTEEALSTSVEWLLSGADEVTELVGRVTSLVTGSEAAADLLGGEYGLALTTVRDLAAVYPGDPGVVISLLLNRVTLKRGEALFLPAGNIHAYLKGLGVELMAASDNVLRGGLTPKYIDVPELLHVLQFESLPVPYLEPGHPSVGVEEFQPDVTDFVLVRVAVDDGAPDARYLPLGPAIVITTAGSVTVSSAVGSAVVPRGASLYITPDEGELTFSGAGELFLAAPGASA